MCPGAVPHPVPAAGANEFRRGWRVLLLALVGAGTTASVTLLYGFGALVVPLEQAHGWSRGELQLAISFMSAGVVVASQLAGWLNLRWGMRAVTLSSLLAMSAAYLALIAVRDSIWWLYLGFFLVPIAGAGVTFVTWTQLVNQWFKRRRGLALALVLCGSGVAAAVLPPLLTWTVERWTLPAAWALMGLVPLLLTLPLAWRHLVPSPQPERSREGAAAKAVLGPDGTSLRAALRSRRFWVINVALTLVVSAVVGMVTNTVPLLRDMGLSATQASSVFSAFGVALIAGRLLAGWLLDKLWAPGVAAVALGLPAIGCALLWSAGAHTPMALLVLAVALAGIGAGAEFDLSAYLIAMYFDLKDYGRLFGMHLGLITAGSMLAPLLFAAMLESGCGYGPLLSYCMVSFTVGPLLLLTLGRRQVRSGTAALEASTSC